jgi:hypothetical protein
MAIKVGDMFENNNGVKFVVTHISKNSKMNHIVNYVGKRGRLLNARNNSFGVSPTRLDLMIKRGDVKYVGVYNNLSKDYHFYGSLSGEGKVKSHKRKNKKLLEESSKAKKVKSELGYFTGSEKFYKSSVFANVVHTEGIKHVIDKLEAYWLLDVVSSYQKGRSLKEFQIWKLEVYSDNSAVVTMRENSDSPVVVKQKIPYTDFEIASFEWYVVYDGNRSTIMLKGEN